MKGPSLRVAGPLTFCLAIAALPGQNPAEQIEKYITADRIKAGIYYLAHDAMEGRGVGTRADALTRAYLRSQFEFLGLQPAGLEGSYEQDVPIVGISANVTQPLSVVGKNGTATFEAPTDYTAEAGRPDAMTAWNDAEIVFVGYGINAPEENWDDYKDVDLTGKIALVMNNDPEDDPNSFAGKTRLYYGRWSYKYEEAARRGAVGAIVIHTTPSAGYGFQVIQAGHGKEDFWLRFDPSIPTLAIRSWCSEGAAKQMAQLGGFDLDELRAQAQRRDFKPVLLGVTANLATKNVVRELQSGNVLAKIEGSDPKLKDQVVVVTAHFDHLGIGRPKNGDEIYNGALDNASGTAAMLNVAYAMSHMDPAPRRTVMFAAVTAEESGLLGSLYYARNPTVPARQIVANFNIDGINIWGETKDISVIGHGKNSLTGLAEAVAQRRGRELVPDPQPELGLFYRSDHFSFARIGVPSAYFKAGDDFLENKSGRVKVKSMYTRHYYHQPSDELDPRWKLGGAEADTRLLLECLVRVAQSDDQPKWAAGDVFERLWVPAL